LRVGSEDFGIFGVFDYFRPSGDLITTTQDDPHRKKVVFFERNGLKHGEFVLKDIGARVEKMRWNATTEILALLLVDENGVSFVVVKFFSLEVFFFLGVLC